MQLSNILSTAAVMAATVAALPSAAAGPDLSKCSNIFPLGNLLPSGPNSVSITLPCIISQSFTTVVAVIDATKWQNATNCPYSGWDLKPAGLQKLEIHNPQDDALLTSSTGGELTGKPFGDPVQCPSTSSLKVNVFFDDIRNASNFYLETMGFDGY